MRLLRLAGMSELVDEAAQAAATRSDNESALPRATSVVQTYLARIRAAAAAGNMDLVMQLTDKVEGQFLQAPG